MDFDDFVAENRPRLRAALVAAYGPEIGIEVTADAMAYAWSNWETLSAMTNPAGYLYWVGRSAARRYLRPQGFLPESAPEAMPRFEPGLAPALESLTEPQRVSVVLVHALGWTLRDAADVLDISVSSVRTHIHRAMSKLRTALHAHPRADHEVTDHAG